MIPVRLLPFTVTLIRPAVGVDRYNNPTYDYGPAATRTSIRAWIEQADLAREDLRDGRDPIEGGWKLITNHADVDANDRLDWAARVYDLDGPAWPVHTPAGFHHTEASLRRVEG